MIAVGAAQVSVFQDRPLWPSWSIISIWFQHSTALIFYVNFGHMLLLQCFQNTTHFHNTVMSFCYSLERSKDEHNEAEIEQVCVGVRIACFMCRCKHCIHYGILRTLRGPWISQETHTHFMQLFSGCSWDLKGCRKSFLIKLKHKWNTTHQLWIIWIDTMWPLIFL